MSDVDPVTEIEQALRWWAASGDDDCRRWAKAMVERIRTDLALRAALLGAPSSAPSSPVGATEPIAGAPGHTDAAQAQQERRARWEKAIPDRVGVGEVIDAMMAVADAEMADLKAEVEALRSGIALATSEMDRAEVDRDLLKSVQIALEVEVERLKAEATWDRLAAETGAERAQGEYEHQGELLEDLLRRGDQRANRLTAHLDEARATIGRVKALADEWLMQGSKHRWPVVSALEDRTLAIAGKAIRAALDAPTEPAPDLDVSRDAPSPTPDGFGLWLSTPMGDPPKREPEDPLAAAKARLEKAMRDMEPTP